MKIKNNKKYYISGGILCLIAVIFSAVALTHPELSFPWPNPVSYIIYALYAIYTVLVFFMPKFKNPSLAVCGIVGADFVSLSLIAIYFGTRNTPHESSLYLIFGLALVCAANFANIALQKKRNSEEKQ